MFSVITYPAINHFGLVGNIYTYQRMGNKSNQNSRAIYFSEILRSSVVWGMQRYSKVEDKLLYLAHPTTKKEAHLLVGLFGLGVLLWHIHQVTQKAANVEWGA